MLLRIKLIGKYFLLLILIYGCSDEQKSEKIIAKVNESVLSKKMLDSALASNSNSAKLKDEFINDWIETEILYQEAVKEDILDNPDYKNLINRSKKELAGIIYLKKMLSEKDFSPTDEELSKYYNDYKNDFRLKEDLYKLNIAKTNSFDKAVKVRSILLEGGWRKAIESFKKDSLTNFSEEFKSSSEFESTLFNRLVSAMLQGETSIVFESTPENYIVVQLIAKYKADSIAPFDVEKENVKSRLIVLKQKEFIKGYLKEIVAEHKLEIERYTE